MNKALTNEEFINKLLRVNAHFRKGEFKVLSQVKKHPQSLIIKDEFGYCKMTVNSLFKGSKPSIKASIFPKNYLINKLSKINKLFFSRKIRIIGEYQRDTPYILVNDEFGICNVLIGNLYKNKNPTILSAIDKTSYFINKSKKETNNIFLYTKTEYPINGDGELTITCKTHGDFKTTPNIHFQQKTCKKCSMLGLGNNIRLTNEEFIMKSKNVHFERYNYDLVDYINSHTPVKILCEKHGVFEQRPNNHINGSGCSNCTSEYKVGSIKWWCKICEGKKGVFYVLKCSNKQESFIKIGITCKSIKYRYRKKVQMPYTFEVLHEEHSNNLYEIAKKESLFKKHLKIYHYQPKIKFGGSKTECFSSQAWNKLAELQLWLEENRVNIKDFSKNYLENLQNQK